MIALNFEILLILLVILINGLLAMAEISIVSARKFRLKQRAETGSEGAQIALDLAEDPNRFLSTIQIGITLVGVFAGAFGGATVARALSDYFSRFPVLDPYSDVIGVAIVVVAITYLSLVVGELVPKRLALHQPERIAERVAKPMQWLSSVGRPAVFLLSASTDAVLKLFGIQAHQAPAITEEEIRGLIEQGAETGIFEAVESDMVERVLRLGDRSISSLMTPRTQIEALDVNDTLAENLLKIQQAPHAQFPVCEGSLDRILGIVHVKTLLYQSMNGKGVDLASAIEMPVFVPENMPALKVLESFQQTGRHIALVTDEYGIVQGLVTLTDILEGIVGDIPTADELANLQIVQREDGSLLLDGLLPIDQLKELLEIDTLPREERGNYQTLGGFVLNCLEKIPAPADTFHWLNWRFEVVDMDGTRVDKVLATRIPPDQTHTG